MGSRAVSQGLIELGERIRKCRREKHISQEVLAELADISVNTVSRIEGGQTAMSVEIFARMVQALEADAGELLGGQFFDPERKRTLDNLAFRISHLRREDREIVTKTMEAMLDGFSARR